MSAASQPEEVVVGEPAKLGLVQSCLPWHWKIIPRLPGAHAAVNLATDVCCRIGASHPAIAVVLEKTEEHLRVLAKCAIDISDNAARSVDGKLEFWMQEANESRKKISQAQKSVRKTWDRREELTYVVAETVVSNSVVQFSLRLTDYVLSLMDKWTVQYQKRLILSTRRWIRRTRRSGLRHCKQNRKVAISAHQFPHGRVSFVPDFWSFWNCVYDVNENGAGDDAGRSCIEDRKRKVDEVSSDSEESEQDPDYEPDDADTTDSLEYNSDDQTDTDKLPAERLEEPSAVRDELQKNVNEDSKASASKDKENVTEESKMTDSEGLEDGEIAEDSTASIMEGSQSDPTPDRDSP